MSEHVIYNKRKICFTEVGDFTDFQGVGSDPLYKRFESVQAVLRTSIDDRYRGFLAEPVYHADEDIIEWFVDEWEEYPRRLTDLTGEERTRYERIKEETVQHYRNAAQKLENEDLLILGGALRFISDDTIFCYDNKVSLVAWGMRYDIKKHNDVGSLMYSLPKKPQAPTYYQVRFSPGTSGTLNGNGIFDMKKGDLITAGMIPQVSPAEGYRFIGWDADPSGTSVSGDMVFTALYEPVIQQPKEEKKEEPQNFFNVQFLPGEHGKLKGVTNYTLPAGSMVTAAMIPKVKPKWRYKFVGWDMDPLASAVTGNAVFTAKYEKKGWFAAIWPWLWKILLALLLLLLLFLLLRNCSGCSRRGSGSIVPPTQDTINWDASDPYERRGGIYDTNDPYRAIPTPPEYRDILPPNEGVLPPIGNDPIRRQPGEPVILENRLNVWMKNEDGKTIMDLARDFKNRYPGDQYQVVYYDAVIQRMQISVPPEEREAMKQRLPQEFAPEYELEVFDETFYTGSYIPSDPAMSDSRKNWYLNTIGAFNAWETSMGSDSIIVAVVDNGFNLNHREFVGKVVKPYNVWMHNDQIFSFPNDDHGTHVAGTAIALANNGTGLCGIAPKCKFMPIQVTDRQGNMTFSSILDGILFAIYQGADVVNVSLGVQFGGMGQIPEQKQREIIRNYFKEEEHLWNEVSRVAGNHNTIIVVAAGNDNLLAGMDPLKRPENMVVVSAVDKSGNRLDKAYFSNYGEYTTVSAPGVDIYSSWGNDYKSIEGTSMAAPIVTGSVALMKSINKEITAKQVICVLRSTGKDVNDKIGPLIQLDKALLKVKNNDVTDCTPVAEPSHGDVEITLQWDNLNDLDLYCQDPHGHKIYYGAKKARCGGELEIDMNRGGRGTNNPIEHIYWPSGAAPQGTYTVVVKHYAKYCSVNESIFTVKVKYGNKTETYRGKVSPSNSSCTVCSFTMGNGSQGTNSR